MATPAANVKNRVERIERIREELKLTLRDLREKIKALEAERTRLMVEIEEMRKTAESRVAALETEVGQMREEAKSLRELLGVTPKETAPPLDSQKNQLPNNPT